MWAAGRDADRGPADGAELEIAISRLRKTDRSSSMMETVSLGPLDRVARPAHSYERFGPNIFNLVSDNPALRRYVLNELSVSPKLCPAEGVWALRDCTVIDGKFAVTSKGLYAEETVVDASPSTWSPSDDRGQSPSLRARCRNDDPIVLFAKAGAANYGHVLVEMLPRLLTLKRLGIERANMVLPAEMTRFAEALNLTAASLGLSLSWIDVEPGSRFVADELLVTSPVSKHNARKSFTLVDLVNALCDQVRTGDQPTSTRRLLVWRRRSEQRAPHNDGRFLIEMVSRGYEVVYPAELTFAEQISLFANATHIVGLLGAGLTNSIFAKASARVFMIDPGLYDFFYWDLACVRRQDFSWYFSEPLVRFDTTRAQRAVAIAHQPLITSLTQAGFFLS